MSGLAEQEIGTSPLVRRLRIVGAVLLIAASVAALVVIVQGLGGGSKGPAKQVTRITVIDTPPPPPPPPPKEEPKREPPKESPKEVKLEQPKQVEQAPQEAQQLKMEGQAGDGPSAFASGAVNQDYIGSAIGNGSGGTLQYAFFTNALQRHIQGELARNRKVKNADYRVMVAIWLGQDGVIQRAELAGTTGNAEADEALRSALLDLGPLRTAVPPSLPQPVRLRVSNRITG